MTSKYSKGDRLMSTSDFFMNSGALAFKKGDVREVLRVDSYNEGSEAEYDYILESRVDPFHPMPDEAIDKYFEKVDPQTVNLKVTDINERHVFATLFMNGASLGHLIFDHGEYQLFSTIILMGTKQTGGHIKDTSDYDVFKKWAEENAD